MKKYRYKILRLPVCVLSLSVLLSSCAAPRDFKSEADERLFRSIENGGDLYEVQQSVASGANIDKLQRGRFISLNMVEFAAGTGRVEIAAWLIDNGADVNFKTSIMGETLLMSMAAAGEYELCKLLLERGADITARDRVSDTALEYAFRADGSVSEHDIDRLVTLLIENGAEIRGSTLTAALSGHYAGNYRYGLVRRAAAALYQSGETLRLRPALCAAILGDTNGALALIRDGSVSDEDKRDILCYTAAFGTAAELEALSANGLDLFATDSGGNTLFAIAERYGNTETAGLLELSISAVEVGLFEDDFSTAGNCICRRDCPNCNGTLDR